MQLCLHHVNSYCKEIEKDGLYYTSFRLRDKLHMPAGKCSVLSPIRGTATEGL